MRSLIISIIVLLVGGDAAIAEPRLRVQPTSVRPGDAVLVTVDGVDGAPRGTADGKQLEFFRAKRGYHAVFAVPLDANGKQISIEVGERTATVAVRTVVFPEADVVVEDEYANPPADLRKRIDADNAAILAALRAGDKEPAFSRSFSRPRGKVTSRFGEWRTFNDGHRSQHLGVDVRAREGTRVNAVNAGTVTLVTDTFLAGKVVVVAHGGGIASAYFHLSRAAVVEGETVAHGQAIGRVGETGRTTGPHLHVAIHVRGGFVDPQSFFALPITVAPTAVVRR